MVQSNRKYIIDKGWQVMFKDMNLSFQDVLRHANLPHDLLMRKSPTVNADEYFRLWDSLAYFLKADKYFPSIVVESVSVEAFSPPLFACLCSTDMNMAIQRLAHYKPIIGPVRLEYDQNDVYTRVAFKGLPENAPPPKSLIAFELIFWVQIARLTTREHIVPTAVHITVDLPEIEAYEAFFGVSITKDNFNGLTFSAEDASRPFLTVNDAMWEIFEPELNRRMDDLNKESPFRDRVRACLMEILASGHYSMNDVASRLAVSSRTLQRRLKAENTTFQKELDSLREELARHYLSSSDYSSGQIAFLLGYEEPNSFFRAFRAWTGQTPEVVRSGYIGNYN